MKLGVVRDWLEAVNDGAEGVRLASQFLVDAHRVASYFRHDGGLEPAPAAAGLTAADEVFG